jgi:dipeptidase D
MERKLNNLQPNSIWNYFEAICQVPRPSKHEEKIIAFLEAFAAEKGLKIKKDEAGNVLISKPASAGFEDRQAVVLQSHLDMVCEKNSNVEHDFMTDPIKPYIDGEWVKAEGTTLGADCGIGIAASLAVLADTNLQHGPIECLFTVDEETGLTGAFALQPGFFDGKVLLNLDSEDEGEIFIGCAGGIDTLANFPYKKEKVPAGFFPIKLSISGLKGGHSGDDINKGRGNAIRILARFLWLAYHHYGIRLAKISGGNLRNAIPREACAIVMVQNGYKENLVADFNIFKHDIAVEYALNEPALKIDHGSTNPTEFVFDDASAINLINALFLCPNGVQSMSSRMPGMVETSTNLASVKMDVDNAVVVTTSQRSEIESGKIMVADQVMALFELTGAKVRHSDGYPGWTPNPDSPVLKVAVDTYKKLFGNAPKVRSIHAGLECGLFLEKYPQLDMVSFGPTILGAHSPDERLNIASVKKFWEHLVLMLSSF